MSYYVIPRAPIGVLELRVQSLASAMLSARVVVQYPLRCQIKYIEGNIVTQTRYKLFTPAEQNKKTDNEMP